MAMTVNVHENLKLAARPAPEKFAKFADIAKFANFNGSVPRTPLDAASNQRGRPLSCHPEVTRDLVKRR